MLRWCAYCQEFQGEIAPLEVFTTTHGICPACKSKGIVHLDSEIENSHRLREIQGLLYEAGKTGDAATATLITHFAMNAGLRPVDILLGLITPLLYRIGDEWESGQITISDQKRFSAFCEQIYEILKVEVNKAAASAPESCRALVFFFNLPGNNHTLGIRIISLWLRSRGIETQEFLFPPSAEELVALVAEHRPCAILVSISLETQKADLCAIACQMESLPAPRPGLIAGGYAVKHQLIQPISGTLYVENLIGLDDLIWALVSCEAH